MKEYFDALCAEIRLRGENCDRTVTSIYIGGGTPSLADAFFPALRNAVFGCFNVAADAEISTEANPESVTEDFIAAAKEFGVNRVSVGVQSLSDLLLKRIGRAHDRETALAALSKLVLAFPSVGADVMVGLPSETDEDVRKTISELSDFSLTHLSCYGLILEKGTRLYREAKKGVFTQDEDRTADRYDLACEILRGSSFDRYEISNFCREGKVCRYNTSVWQYADYFGLGLGASSFMKNEGGFPAKRMRNTCDLNKYIETGGRARPFVRNIGVEEGKEEFLMLGLRLADGADLLRYKSLFGVDLLAEKAEKISRLSPFLDISAEKIAIKPDRFYVSNSIISDLL